MLLDADVRSSGLKFVGLLHFLVCKEVHFFSGFKSLGKVPEMWN